MTIQEACSFISENESKLRAFSRYHWNKRLASNRCSVAWEADDLYQETITRVLENLHQFKEGNFLNWVGVIMTNLSCSLLVKHKTEERNNKAIQGNTTVVFPHSDEDMDLVTATAAMYKGIETLPIDQGLCLLYTLSPEEEKLEPLAKELGISYTSLRQFRFQGIHRLRKKLAPYNTTT